MRWLLPLCTLLLVPACYVRNDRDCTDEICNGRDDDCDDLVDEGFDLGRACDGPDKDRCEDGFTECASGGLGVVCDDGGDEHPELCNGADDDCDPTSPDGMDEPGVGDPCDGPDSDMCPEGSTVCVDTLITCNDASGDNAELCNSLDDDCDGTPDEGYDVSMDIANCGGCGVACTNSHGTTSCLGGTCTPVCLSGAEDCNLDPTDGCEVKRDLNPGCTDVVEIGTVSGDLGGPFLEHAGAEESWLVAFFTEDSGASTPITGMIELESPPGVDFDLYAYCGACGGAIADASNLGPGETDVVYIRGEDTSGPTDTQTVYLEVRFVSATVCGDWQLRVTGGVAVGLSTCN